MRSLQISREKAWPRRPLRVRYRHWVFALPFVQNYRGMVIGRTILIKGDESEASQTLFRHEFIHQEQIDRHGIARFYLIYFRDYLLNLWRLRHHDAAYAIFRLKRKLSNADAKSEKTWMMIVGRDFHITVRKAP